MILIKEHFVLNAICYLVIFLQAKENRLFKIHINLKRVYILDVIGMVFALSSMDDSTPLTLEYAWRGVDQKQGTLMILL